MEAGGVMTCSVVSFSDGFDAVASKCGVGLACVVGDNGESGNACVDSRSSVGVTSLRDEPPPFTVGGFV